MAIYCSAAFNGPHAKRGLGDKRWEPSLRLTRARHTAPTPYWARQHGNSPPRARYPTLMHLGALCLLASLRLLASVCWLALRTRQGTLQSDEHERYGQPNDCRPFPP